MRLMPNKSKRDILLIGDTPGWAFDNIIEFVKKHIKNHEIYYDYTIYNQRQDKSVESDFSSDEINTSFSIPYKKNIPFQGIPGIRSVLFRAMRFLNKKGLILVDSHGKKRRIKDDNTYDLVIFLDYYMDKDAKFDDLICAKKVKGVFTDGFPPKGIKIDDNYSIEDFIKKYLHDADAILVGSKSIASIYQNKTTKSIFCCNMAYDESVFKPKKTKKQNKSLVVGWTGNPKREFKGFDSIIIPTIEILKAKNYNIELRTQFSGSLNSLADFWQGVDLAIIASEADAGPSMFMEASLCGVPSISTRIGMPSYVIINYENGLFCDRNVADFIEKIKMLINDTELLQKMKTNIRKAYIEKLGVHVQIKNWENLFETIFKDD